MKLKLVTVFLGATTLLFALTSGILYAQTKFSEETIADREWTITSYQKVIKAIARSGNISVEALKVELEVDFNIYKEMGYNNNYNKEYYYVLHPKTKVINHQEIPDFIGFQLIFNHQKTFKSLDFYKP